MTTTTNDATPLKKIFFTSEAFSWKTYLLSIIVVCLFFALAHRFSVELYALLAVIGSFCLWIMLHYPKIWLYGVALGCAVFLKQPTDGIDAVDVFGGIMFNMFLCIWIGGKLLVKLEKISFASIKQLKFKNTFSITSLSEKLFVLFYFLLLFNSIIAYFNGVVMLNWAREFMLFVIILYCFPLIEYFKTKRDWVIFFLLFGLSVLFIDFKQLYNCYLVYQDISYAFQLGGTIRANQGLYSSVIITGIAFFFFSQKKKSKLFAFIIIMFSTFAIITTFSRGFWGAIIICSLLFLFFLNYKQILQFLLIILFSAGFTIICIDTFLPKQSDFLQKYIVKRFSSTTQGRSDISVRTRIDEINITLPKIKASPIYGYGLSSTYSRYFRITRTTVTTSFIHNGYLNLAFKAGIPMSVLFHLIFLLFAIRGICTAWKLKRQLQNTDKDSDVPFYLAMAVSGALTLTLFFITNFIGVSFYMRDNALPTAISLAFIHAADIKMRSVNNKNLTPKTQ